MDNSTLIIYIYNLLLQYIIKDYFIFFNLLLQYIIKFRLIYIYIIFITIKNNSI